MARHQHLLFNQLHLRPKKTVLALSCGNGATCEQLVQFSDVNVVGIDTDVRLVSSMHPSLGKVMVQRLNRSHAQKLPQKRQVLLVD